MRIIRSSFWLASTAAVACAGAASAQTIRAQPKPPAVQPGLQAPNTSSQSQAFSALNLKLDALKQSLGRQVVALHFTPTELPPWPNNNFGENEARAIGLCQQALGDRFGRLLSRRVQGAGGGYYFTHVLCEVKP